MKKLKEFTIMVKVELATDFTIKAESLEEAIQKSKEFKLTDVVSFDGEYIDGNMEVMGVYK